MLRIGPIIQIYTSRTGVIGAFQPFPWDADSTPHCHTARTARHRPPRHYRSDQPRSPRTAHHRLRSTCRQQSAHPCRAILWQHSARDDHRWLRTEPSRRWQRGESHCRLASVRSAGRRAPTGAQPHRFSHHRRGPCRLRQESRLRLGLSACLPAFLPPHSRKRVPTFVTFVTCRNCQAYRGRELNRLLQAPCRWYRTGR